MQKNFIDVATKELAKLSGKINKMTYNIIIDCMKELVNTGSTESCFKSVNEFFVNCGCKLSKEEGSVITTITF